MDIIVWDCAAGAFVEDLVAGALTHHPRFAQVFDPALAPADKARYQHLRLSDVLPQGLSLWLRERFSDATAPEEFVQGRHGWIRLPVDDGELSSRLLREIVLEDDDVLSTAITTSFGFRAGGAGDSWTLYATAQALYDAARATAIKAMRRTGHRHCQLYLQVVDWGITAGIADAAKPESHRVNR